MRVLIVYASKYGGVAECAHDLQQHLDIPSDVLPVGDTSIMLDEYDIIVAGGSIHKGSIQKMLRKFLKKNKTKILKKKFAFFISCLMPPEKAEKTIVAKQLPAELLNHAFASVYPGAVLDFNKMNWLEKSILKKIAGAEFDPKGKDDSIIKDFAREINKQ